MIELLLEAEAALSAGRLDRAETLYRQVVGADPRNSIAIVGLARVALERSDEVGALTFARRALAIDPENNAAQRLVQRLEQMLGNRGVSVPAPSVHAPAAPTTTTPTTTTPTTPGAPTSGSDAGAGVVGAVEPAAAAADAASPATAGPSAAEPTPRSYLDRLLRRRPHGR